MFWRFLNISADDIFLTCKIYRVIFLTGTPINVSDYIASPIEKVLSVRIYLPKKVVIFKGVPVKKITL